MHGPNERSYSSERRFWGRNISPRSSDRQPGSGSINSCLIETCSEMKRYSLRISPASGGRAAKERCSQVSLDAAWQQRSGPTSRESTPAVWFIMEKAEYY